MIRIENEWRYFDEKLGIPYPWYTRPCLEYLDKLDFSKKRIWEFGVGDSTAWFKRKGASVEGVDNDFGWSKMTGSRFAFYMNEYVGSMGLGTFYDIITIDGDWRDECTEASLRHLKRGGLLIIDNYKQKTADLEHWPKTEKLIKGLEVMYFKEPEHIDWQTIIVKK